MDPTIPQAVKIPKQAKKKFVTNIEAKKSIFSRTKIFLNVNFDKEDMRTVGRIAIDGVLINFTVMALFSWRFNWYSWLGWGLLYWLIENKFIKTVRRLWGS